MEYENIIFELELLGGVTTVRTVGGIADFDTRCRDDSAAGKVLAPRILAANEGISVPGGHMAGSVAVAAHNNAEALAQLKKASAQKVDLVKLMITGGVLDAAGDDQSRLRCSPQAGLHRCRPYRIPRGREGCAGKRCRFH